MSFAVTDGTRLKLNEELEVLNASARELEQTWNQVVDAFVQAGEEFYDEMVRAVVAIGAMVDKSQQAADILARSRARVLVTVDGFLDNRYVAMLDGHDLPHLERIVVLRTAPGQDLPPAAETWESFLGSGEADAVTDLSVAARRAQLTPDTVADLLFTSGTTGKPKGVICTHGQTLRTVGTWANVVGLGGEDRYLAINPFFHSFGYKAGIVAWLVTGCVLVPMPVFDVPKAMELITAQRISMVPGPPTLYQTILNHPDRDQLDSSSLRLAVTGAASVPVSLVEQMRDDLGFDTVITAYGLTEGCGFATMCRRTDDATTIATTSGRAMPGIEVHVVDDEGRPLPAGEAGEVVIRGYNVMQGYFEDPAATAETIDADGWLHTGDVGVMDERGYLRITDRKKDMFIVGGFNCYPAEIEKIMLGNPAYAQVAVVGVIAAAANNAEGIVGVAANATTLGVDVLFTVKLVTRTEVNGDLGRAIGLGRENRDRRVTFVAPRARESGTCWRAETDHIAMFHQ